MSDAYSTSDAMFHINWEHDLSPHLTFVQPTVPGLGSGVSMTGVMVRIGRGHLRTPVPSGFGGLGPAPAPEAPPAPAPEAPPAPAVLPAQLPLFEGRAAEVKDSPGELALGPVRAGGVYSLRSGPGVRRSPGGTRAAQRHADMSPHVWRTQISEKLDALRRAPMEADDGRERLVRDLEVHQLELELQNLDLQESQGALAASRNRYAELYDRAPVAYFTFDLSGRVLEANLTGAALVGRERAEILGSPFTVLARSLDARAFFAHLRRCRDGEPRVVSDFSFRTPAGGQLEVQAVSTPLAGPEGGVVGVRTALTDVSDRKAAEVERCRALELERLFRSRFESLGRPLPGDVLLQELARLAVPWLADCCIVVVPEAGRLLPRGIAHVDPVVEAKLRKENCTFSVDLGAAGVVADCWRTGRPVLQTNCVGPGALPECGCLSGPAPRSVLAVPMVVGGEPAGFIVFSFIQSSRVHDQDIPIAEAIARRGAMALENARLLDEANQAVLARDQQLAAANDAVALRDGVLRVVAHDLRSPLAGIRMFGDALLRQVPEVERTAYNPVQMLRRTVDRMDHLIQDLVEAARLDGGALPVSLGPVIVACVLTEAVEAHREAAARADLELSMRVAEGVKSVHADRARLLQAFDNLITNAIKFSPCGGRIEIEAALGSDQEVVVSVRDSGIGVSPEQLPRIFDRFWQATPSDRRGAGLGLSIVKGILDAHRGRIWVESEIGVGTTVHIALPTAG